MEYYVAWELGRINLSVEVNRLISYGWKPQGGISLGEGSILQQAMVRRPEDYYPEPMDSSSTNNAEEIAFKRGVLAERSKKSLKQTEDHLELINL